MPDERRGYIFECQVPVRALDRQLDSDGICRHTLHGFDLGVITMQYALHAAADHLGINAPGALKWESTTLQRVPPPPIVTVFTPETGAERAQAQR